MLAFGVGSLTLWVAFGVNLVTPPPPCCNIVDRAGLRGGMGESPSVAYTYTPSDFLVYFRFATTGVDIRDAGVAYPTVPPYLTGVKLYITCIYL